MRQRLFARLMAAYLILGVTYSVVTPLFEASDELWHYPMVQYLATHGLALPPQDPANSAAWRQEGSQPPLYYMLAAVLTAGIDTSDMAMVRRLNPHADIGVVRPDGNQNMVVHRVEAESFPWKGTALAVHVARLFSVLLGAVTVWATYQLGLALFPDEVWLALGAAGLTAFLPMFLFISGSVNNDNLSNAVGNVLLLLLVRLLKGTLRPQWRVYALLGVLCGAGLLAKLSLGLMLPLTGLVFLWVSWRERDWRPAVLGGLYIAGLSALIAGWWYLRNWQLYGDPSGLNMFLQIVGRRAVAANTAQLWSERDSFLQAYWGFFGGVNVLLPQAVYVLFNGIAIVAAAGLIVYLVRFVGTSVRMSVGKEEERASLQAWWNAGVVLAVLWPVVTFISYLRWTAETPASQGRLLFVALSALSLWMAVGLGAWLPFAWRKFGMGVVVLVFAAVALWTPFGVIAPAYAPAPLLAVADVTDRPSFANDADSGRVALLEADVLTPEVQPEGYAWVRLRWQSEAPSEGNWSVFVHLVTADGVIIGQRDIYPSAGKRAMSDFAAGDGWEDRIAVWIANAAYAPQDLTVWVGWYDLTTGARMHLANGEERVQIGALKLAARPDIDRLGIPNPIQVRFEGGMTLIGYQLSDLSPSVGDKATLTLYWRTDAPIDRDYKIFANILDPATLTKYAASDGMPDNWARPTPTWKAGEIITDVHEWTVSPDAPPGIYETEIGWYWEAPDGTFPRARVMTADGGMAENYFRLTRVRIGLVGEGEAQS